MTARTKKGLQRPDFNVRNEVSGLLAEVRLIAAAIADFSIGAGRGLAMQGPPYFFLVLEGECWLHEEDCRPVRLEVGDSIISLRGDVARLALTDNIADFDDIGEVWRANGAPTASFRGYDMPLRFLCGDSGSRCRLMGSALILSRSTGKSGLVREAPAILRLTAGETRLGNWAAAINETLKPDDGDPLTGFAIAGSALSQFLLIEQLKAYLVRDPIRLTASVRGGEGEKIWNLIRIMQRDPAQSWSIASMARAAAMSRTSFIQSFGALTGTTPFRFLAACRMDHAADLLRTSGLSVGEIGTLSGYQSQRAFRDAFSQAFGMAPHAFRKTLERAIEPAVLA
jgi:AraC-like DNA-binding protein